MVYVEKKEFYKLAWKPIEIVWLSEPYRAGYNKPAEKYETFKFVDNKRQQEVREEGQRKLIIKDVDYSIHKKVFDVSVITDEPVTVLARDKDEKGNVDTVDTEFTFRKMNAYYIKQMMEATIAFGKVPEKADWSAVYDWEDEFAEKFPWTHLTFAAKKAQFNGNSFHEYTFKEHTPKDSVDNDKKFGEEEGLPF